MSLRAYLSCRAAPLWIVAALPFACASPPVRELGGAGADMTAAARTWLDSLPPEMRRRATFAFADAERARWQFVPGIYPGVTLGELDLAQRRAAHALLRCGLSTTGYLKTMAIIRLEDVLRELAQSRGQPADHRDPGRYALAIFGEPSEDQPWGWRLQGHHLSLNFSSVDGVVAAATPVFRGANPAEVRTGPHTGLRVLGGEEDLARALLASLDEDQRGRARLAAVAPSDIVLGPGRALDLLGEPKGIAFAQMRPASQVLLRRLLAEYAHDLRADLADRELERIEHAGIGKVCFAWAGGMAPGEPHYWRLHGPTAVIEYDNTQDDANHVHTVWHDLTNGFGEDALRAHVEAQHRGK